MKKTWGKYLLKKYCGIVDIILKQHTHCAGADMRKYYENILFNETVNLSG